MSKVRWTDSAIRDLRLARERLAADRPDAAQEVIERIVLSTDFLLQHPGVGTLVGYRSWRKWRARRTSYIILYQPDRSGLTVVRVLHDRSDWVSVVE